MTGVAIVAIPSQEDYVWKISSEKVPHMTLLFLGDMTPGPELARIESFLQHLVDTSLFRFGMSVDYRGELGADKADVVFFHKEHAKMIEAARSDMLKNTDIRRAYESTEQFPEWTPHLTLGYPATPAKPEIQDYGLHWVNFDRVALWVDNYDGPTMRLNDNHGMDLAMSDLGISPVLAGVELSHHGVKGMKWGVRKDGSVSSTVERTSRVRRAATDVQALQKPGKFVRTSGGKRQTASGEAVSVAAMRQLAKKSTTDALTNKQLQDAVTRMNLEQQFHTLSKKTSRQTRGQRFVSSLLGTNKKLDKNGNPLPGSGSSHLASIVGEILKSRAKK